MGKKILVPSFDVYNDRPFPEKYTVKDHISNTKLEKGDHYYIQTGLLVSVAASFEACTGFRGYVRLWCCGCLYRGLGR